MRSYTIHCSGGARAPLDLSLNCQRASDFIRKAKAQGATLAVLPEYHLTAWTPQDPSFTTVASQAPSFVTRYQALAAELDINIVPGTIVQPKPDSANGETVLINTSHFISSKGEILGSYTKKNLWHPERPHLESPGLDEPHSVIQTPLGPIGILVCWDLAFPEAFRALIRQGAKIIIIPTFWMLTDCFEKGLKRNPRAEEVFVESMVTARAFENTCCVVFANVGGKKEEGYLGLSQVAMPFIGKLPGSFSGCEEGLKVIDVDMEIIEEAEENYKVRYDLEREDWHYGYEHTKDR
ncbi:MAG: hypothetical protein Q9227_008756 [Pyrenula ochraceoflavens]